MSRSAAARLPVSGLRRPTVSPAEDVDAPPAPGASFYFGDAATALAPDGAAAAAIGEPFWRDGRAPRQRPSLVPGGARALPVGGSRATRPDRSLGGVLGPLDESLHCARSRSGSPQTPSILDAAVRCVHVLSRPRRSPFACSERAGLGDLRAARVDPSRGTRKRAPPGNQAQETGKSSARTAARNGTSKRATPAAAVVTVSARPSSRRSRSRSRAARL